VIFDLLLIPLLNKSIFKFEMNYMKLIQVFFSRAYKWIERNINKHLKNKKLTISIILVIGLLVLIIICIYFHTIACYLFEDSSKENGEFLKVLLSFIGGVFVIWGLWLNARRTKALELHNDINSKGRVDERFKNAIEHLGNNNPAIILGGIHVLHRIAFEDESYRSVVLNILCSYIREITSDESYRENNLTHPTIVIQTILDLIFKSNSNEFIYDKFQANIEGSYLNGANLSEAHLVNSYLYEVELDNANLEGANLEGVKIECANLCRVNFKNANLKYVSIIDTSIIDAYLFKANLEGAAIIGVNFENANLESANLQKTYIQYTNLRDAYLWNTNLKDAHFDGTDLNEANLLEIISE
jgi:uncharacterized protein YjbI with pentapeptide repeats